LIGNVARLDKVKDQAGLLLAFKQLQEQNGGGDCRLIMVGDGSERAELQYRINQLGLTKSVRLLGNRTDVPELLAACDVFVLSSIAEGMPITVLEAMAAGLPVVVTDVGGMASVVQAGVNGALVPARNPDALAQALAEYATDETLRRRHGDAGRARALARFGLDKMVTAYTGLYDELLGARAHAVQRHVMSGVPGPEEH
jgi:glycosyltransferase involved in cell wall biosynthesis